MNLSIEAQAKTQNEQQKDSDVMVQSDNDKIQDYSSDRSPCPSGIQ
jgi:hypothetical protein